MGWVEIFDDESARVCYVKLETGEVSYKRPSHWVQEMTKMFNQGKGATQNSMKERRELARQITEATSDAVMT